MDVPRAPPRPARSRGARHRRDPLTASQGPARAATSAVVTGAGRGIGRAIALHLGAAGRHVVAFARTADAVRETAGLGPNVIALSGDVSREADVERAAEAADARGPLEVWVNNAAVADRRPFPALDPAEWDRIMSINLRGVFLGCRAAVLRMRDRGGVIVNIGSLSGVANVEKFPGLTAYNVSKAGVIALTEAVALEGKDAGIRCVALSPGAVDTQLLRRAAPHLRPGVTPDDVAAIVDFLVSPAGAPLSGVNIPIFSNA